MLVFNFNIELFVTYNQINLIEAVNFCLPQTSLISLYLVLIQLQSDCNYEVVR